MSRKEIKLTEAEEKEIANHSKGVKLLWFGILGVVLACADSGLAFFGVIGIIAVVVGFFMVMIFRKRETIVFKKMEMQQAADLMVRQAQAGAKIDVDKVTSIINK